MKSKNTLIIMLTLIISTMIVLVSSWYNPGEAIMTISIYLLTVLSLGLFFSLYYIIKNKNKTTVNIGDFSDITEDLSNEVIIWTDDSSAVFMNKSLRDLIGIVSLEFDNEKMLKMLFNIEDFDKDSINKFVSSKYNECTFKNNISADDVCITWSTTAIKQNNNCTLYLNIGFNLTEIKLMRNELDISQERYNLLMELSEIGSIVSLDSETYYISLELSRMLGIDKTTISYKEFKKLIHPQNKAIYDSCIKSLQSEKPLDVKFINMDLQILSAGGKYRWYSARFKKMENQTFGGAIIDITEERVKDLLIEKLAFEDDVTGIANRNKLVKIGQDTYQGCAILDYSYWVMVFDLDRFHIINDTCGYHNGNKLLKLFAQNLYKYVSYGGFVARISGDNFAVIMRDYGDDELPIKTAQQVQKDLHDITLDEFASQSITVSVGYAKMPEDGKSFVKVLEHAEFALKSGERVNNSISAYESSMHDKIISDTEVEKSLLDAIENKELKLFYQPKIDLETGNIIGVEALIRWIKPDGSIIPPSEFISIAEKSQLIGRISEFVLEEACMQNSIWQKMGYDKIIMSINFTSADFYKKDIKQNIFETLIKHGLDAEWLEIELTESLALEDIDYAVSQMNSIRELGVKLAMDDFGTGYSSLSYIQTLPITLLKLDRSFIIDVENDTVAHSIVTAVINIAKSKGIKTIAEGVETLTQANILKKIGCNYAQGYLYGKPMSAENIEKYFDEKMNKNIFRR